MAKTPAASGKKKPPFKYKGTSKVAIGGGGGTASKPWTQQSKKKISSREVGSHPRDAITSSETILRGGDDGSRQFYSSVQFVPRRDSFMKSDPISLPGFDQSNVDDTWRVSIGDLVCVENPSDATKCPPGGFRGHHAAPFAVGWRPCQILCLFRERVAKNKLSTKKKCLGPLRAEVRWFYRHADLDNRNRRYEKKLLPKKKVWASDARKKGEREVFETGHVAVIDAFLLLGRLVLKLKRGPGDGKIGADDPLQYPVPAAENHCNRYYLHAEQDIIELYDKKNMLTRGLESSNILLQTSVRKAAYAYLGLSLPKNSGDAMVGGVCPLVSLPSPAVTIQYKDHVAAYYPHCTLDYPWSQLTHDNLLCPHEMRDSFPKWQLCVGDIVAVHCDESTPASDADVIPGRDKWYPYRVPWSHCQVTAIFRDAEEENNASEVPTSSISCEIRWFPRIAEAQGMGQKKVRLIERLKKISSDVERTSEEIFEGKQVSYIDCGSLLGPVFIDEHSGPHDDNPVLPYLNQNRRTVSSAYHCNQSGEPSAGRTVVEFDPAVRVHRGLDASRRFNKSKRNLTNMLKAVLRSRGERAERIRNERSRAVKVKVIGADAGGAASCDVVAEPFDGKRSPYKKRQLFDEDFEDEIGGRKRVRPCDNGDPVEKSTHDTMESVANRDHTQNNATDEGQLTIFHKTRVRCCSGPFHVDVLALKSFYDEIDIIPPFDSYNKQFSTGGVARLERGQWKVKVGDMVTIEYEGDANDSDAAHSPFLVPWAPAEIVSIYRVHETKESCRRLHEKLSKGDQEEKSSLQDDDACEIMVEVRWFYRSYDIPGASNKKSEPVDDNDLEEIFETDHIDVCSADGILSPIRLHDVARQLTAPSTIAGMPYVHYYCSQFWSIRKCTFVPSGSSSDRMYRGRKHSAHKVALSKIQCMPSSSVHNTAPAHIRREKSEKVPQDTMKLKSVVMSDRTRNNASNEKQPLVYHKTRVRCCSGPFHVDVSALKSFYEEIDIIPPCDSYDKLFSTGGDAKQERGQWKVKLGDTVAIAYEQTSKDSNAIHFPFIGPWAPAEVVCIYCVHKTKESCARLREKSSKWDTMHGNDAGKIMVEIRWFYRSHEIPGASKKKTESVDDDELEEVFETDKIDSCSADSILSPIQLHDVARQLTAPSTIAGMPCIHYHCSRLWSIHRCTFVPSGSHSNRLLRGRMHSAYNVALSKLQISSSVESTSSANQKCEKSWKEAFQSAIQKLSLAEAAQDAQENGMVLACREKERAQITSFLRKAICGLVQSKNEEGGEEEKTKNLKSSLFIAGPPGTGKTASVRSIIAELQKEQHQGLLPEFNFIALNGMELRHPFDAYVKFWEAVSGTRKERLPAGEAAHELENYFCGDQGEDPDSSDSEDEEDDEDENKDVDNYDRPVTVLMLDEIDYLVTKKETLVYNFFDWPLRATTARLVVIGISNTINLPEKMSTRVQSRIGGDRCHFKSYNVQDTQTILKTRLGMLDSNPGYAVFEEDAIKFAARKTANLSGDIRKAFQMCKAAAENVLEDFSSGKQKLIEGSWPLVKISDVQKGSRDMFTSIVHKAVSCSTSYEALFLISLGALKRTREDGSFTVKEILTKIESIANASGEPRYMNAHLSFADVLGMANRLGGAGIIQLNTYVNSPWPWASTHLHTSEILACYRDARHRKLAEKHLASQRLF